MEAQQNYEKGGGGGQGMTSVFDLRFQLASDFFISYLSGSRQLASISGDLLEAGDLCSNLGRQRDHWVLTTIQRPIEEVGQMVMGRITWSW